MNTLRNLMSGILMLLALITVSVPTLAAIDTTQPTTSATLTGTKGSDGWYTTSITVTLSATDGADGSGVAKTEYSLDNLTWLTYSAPFVIDRDGDQYVYFRSTDLAGNVETPAKSQEVKINKGGLVGLWHMDNNWLDSSVVGNNGFPYYGVTFSSNAKVGTHSGSFDGINDYVDVGNGVSLNSNAITVGAWVNLAGSGGRTVYARGSTTNNMAILAADGSGFTGGIAGKPILRIGIPNNVNLTGNTSLANGVWYHIVGTYDGLTMKIYVNGSLDAHAPATGNLYSGSTYTHIGSYLGNVYFNGQIDELQVYNRALSDAEIQSLYSNYVVRIPTVNAVTSPTATPIITLSGTKPAGTAIVVNGNTRVPLDGTTSWQANYTLSQGLNTLSITAVDSQNFISLPMTLTVVLDSISPQVTTTTPTNNAILRTAPGSVTFTLADALSPLDFISTLNGAKVTNASGSIVAGTWSSSGSGTTGLVTFTPSVALGDGSYSATIKPTDSLSNGSTYTFTFTVDSTPPLAPAIDPATTPTATTGKTITGTKSSDSASVTVSCGGATIGPVAYPTATTWSVNVSGLKEGSNTITAYAVDMAGNQSAATTATITVDTTPPTVGATPAGGIYNSTQSVALAASESAVIYYTMDGSTPTTSSTKYSQPIAIAANATLKYFGRDLAGNVSEIKTENYVIDTTPPILAISTLNDGTYTNNETLNIAGTVTDNTAVQGVSVNDTAIQVNADGSFSYALLLKSGVNIITIVATDSAGNKATDTRAVTLDKTAPVLAVTTPADNSKTGKALLEVSGTVDKTSTVAVKMNNNVQNALMNDGAFTVTITLVPGYNTIEITATDLAGNQSSLKRTVVFDDQVPSLAVTVPNQDIRTNQNSLTIKGTVYDALSAVGVTISKDSEIFKPPVVDGSFEQTVNFTEEKTYGIVVTATNEVGTSTSVQRNVIYDITPPALSIDPVTTPTSQSSQSVSGTREAGAAVTVTCTTATVGEVSYRTATTWEANIFGLREGENVVTATSADAAGNASTATATIVLATRPPVPATRPPQITITATPDIIWPPNHQMVPVTIAGGVKANSSDIKSVSITVSDEYGKYEYKNLSFGSTVMLEAWRNGNDTDGRRYTITIVVTDWGGGTTAKTATVTVPHDMSYPKDSSTTKSH